MTIERRNERELLEEVLRSLKDAPAGIAHRFAEILDPPEDRKGTDRSEALRKLFEELARE